MRFRSLISLQVINVYQTQTRDSSGNQSKANPVNPSSDEYLNSPYNITVLSNMRVMRMNGLIPKRKFVLIFKQILPTLEPLAAYGRQ